MNSPNEERMEVVYRILRYLKLTPGKGQFFKRTSNRIMRYSVTQIRLALKVIVDPLLAIAHLYGGI